MDHTEDLSGSPKALRHVIGMMTGTSIDGVDAAWMRINGTGLDMRAELVAHISRPIGESLARVLRRAANQEPMTAGEFAKIAFAFGERHAEVAAELAGIQVQKKTGHADVPAALTPGPSPDGRGVIDIIAVHGQTVFHAPPHSWQLINVSPIAARLGCPVVFDLRQADLAGGGQGAPITPMADWILFRSNEQSRAIVNLGGYCNVTLLPREEDNSPQRRRERGERQRQIGLKGEKRAVPFPTRSITELEQVRGFDVCACNQLLDAVARDALGVPFDNDGEAASEGEVNFTAAEALRDILFNQARGGRSLGTGDEAIKWVERYVKGLSPNDLAASAVWAVANVIAATISDRVDEIYLAGGGARHQALVQVLQQKSAMPIGTTDALGIPIEAREAAAMAVLGALCADGIPITLPHVTGCFSPAPVAGAWMTCASAMAVATASF